MGHFPAIHHWHARAQGVLGVLDPNFVPRGYDELDLFALQQSFLYWCSLMYSKRHMEKSHS
jgi:hypothetical protein